MTFSLPSTSCLRKLPIEEMRTWGKIEYFVRIAFIPMLNCILILYVPRDHYWPGLGEEGAGGKSCFVMSQAPCEG